MHHRWAPTTPLTHPSLFWPWGVVFWPLTPSLPLFEELKPSPWVRMREGFFSFFRSPHLHSLRGREGSFFGPHSHRRVRGGEYFGLHHSLRVSKEFLCNVGLSGLCLALAIASVVHELRGVCNCVTLCSGWSSYLVYSFLTWTVVPPLPQPSHSRFQDHIHSTPLTPSQPLTHQKKSPLPSLTTPDPVHSPHFPHSPLPRREFAHLWLLAHFKGRSDRTYPIIEFFVQYELSV